MNSSKRSVTVGVASLARASGLTSVGCAMMNVGCISLSSVVASNSFSCSTPRPSVGNTSVPYDASAMRSWPGSSSTVIGYCGWYLWIACAIVPGV